MRAAFPMINKTNPWARGRYIRALVVLAVMVTVAPLGSPGATAESVVWAAEIAASTAASTASLKPLLKRLQNHYQETSSFTAKFEESITRVGAPPRHRSGVVSYLRPGRIRFDFAAPDSETIVSDGTTLYDYDPGLNQVIEAPLKQALSTQRVAALLLGAGNVERDFAASPVANAPQDGRDYVALTPKDGGDKIELGVDRASSNIERLVLTDSIGDVTSFEFSQIERNRPVKSSLFTFSPPPGADIVNAQDSK